MHLTVYNLGRNAPTTQLEAARMAYGVRDTHIADPASMKIDPAKLIDKAFAKKLAGKIDRAKRHGKLGGTESEARPPYRGDRRSDQPLLLAREVEMRAPVRQRIAGLGTDAAHGLEPALGRAKDLARIVAELLQEPVERNRADVGQVVHNHERLPLGQGI